MERFNTKCGIMIIVILATATIQRSINPAVTGVAFYTWAMILFVGMWLVSRAMMNLTPRRRKASVLHVSNQPDLRPPYPPSQDLIERLCRQSGWIFIHREADRYRVRASEHPPIRDIDVWYATRLTNVLFQVDFPIRFSLDPEPSGLFARLMMRNSRLTWSAWSMSLGGSCEACPILVANVPPAALDARQFAGICREIIDEVNAFYVELHDKFRYSASGPVTPNQNNVYPDIRSGVPRLRDDDQLGIHYMS